MDPKLRLYDYPTNLLATRFQLKSRKYQPLKTGYYLDRDPRGDESIYSAFFILHILMHQKFEIYNLKAL